MHFLFPIRAYLRLTTFHVLHMFSTKPRHFYYVCRLLLLSVKSNKNAIQRAFRQATLLVFFVGVNVIFLPMHFLGLAGMPRRIPDHPAAYAGSFYSLFICRKVFYSAWHVYWRIWGKAFRGSRCLIKDTNNQSVSFKASLGYFKKKRVLVYSLWYAT